MLKTAYHFGLALAKITTKHGFHDVTPSGQHGLVSGTHTVIQLEDDVSKQTLV